MQKLVSSKFIFKGKKASSPHHMASLIMNEFENHMYFGDVPFFI